MLSKKKYNTCEFKKQTFYSKDQIKVFESYIELSQTNFLFLTNKKYIRKKYLTITTNYLRTFLTKFKKLF